MPFLFPPLFLAKLKGAPFSLFIFCLNPSGVVVLQVLEPQYGMYVWPCAVVLAQYLWTQRAQLRGRTVLEVSRPRRISSGTVRTRLDPSDLPPVSAGRRCESSGGGGSQVRGKGHPVGPGREPVLPGELQTELPGQRCPGGSGAGPDLGGPVSRPASAS